MNKCLSEVGLSEMVGAVGMIVWTHGRVQGGYEADGVRWVYGGKVDTTQALASETVLRACMVRDGFEACQDLKNTQRRQYMRERIVEAMRVADHAHNDCPEVSFGRFRFQIAARGGSVLIMAHSPYSMEEAFEIHDQDKATERMLEIERVVVEKCVQGVDENVGDRMVRMVYEQRRWEVERALFGVGIGVRCEVVWSFEQTPARDDYPDDEAQVDVAVCVGKTGFLEAPCMREK